MQLKKRELPDEKQLEKDRSRKIKEQDWEGMGPLPISGGGDMWEDAPEGYADSCLPSPGLLAYDGSQRPETPAMSLAKATLA